MQQNVMCKRSGKNIKTNIISVDKVTTNNSILNINDEKTKENALKTLLFRTQKDGNYVKEITNFQHKKTALKKRKHCFFGTVFGILSCKSYPFTLPKYDFCAAKV